MVLLNFNLHKLAVAIIPMVLISACKQEMASNTQPGVSKQSMHEHKYPGKPGAPVDMQFQMAKSPAVGEILEVAVQLVNKIPVGRMTVKYTLPAELESTDAEHLVIFDQLETGSSSAITINLVPQAEGVFYVNLFVSMESEGSVQSRSFAIPVNVGDVEPEKHLKKSPGKVSTDEKGRRIISMPAE